jgi:hypothetical protein
VCEHLEISTPHSCVSHQDRFVTKGDVKKSTLATQCDAMRLHEAYMCMCIRGDGGGEGGMWHVSMLESGQIIVKRLKIGQTERSSVCCIAFCNCLAYVI